MSEQDLLGRYRVTQVFRGQGTVRSYKATGPDGAPVSLKIVEAEPHDALAAVERLSVLRSLAHPNLARFVEAQVVESGYAVVREWVEGVSLDVRPLPTETTTAKVAEWVAAAADALAAVHGAGLVHGDVRPSNIVVDPKGHAKLVDVGIPPAHGRVPATGAGAATVRYSSPEELSGQDPTWASDIYRMGIVLYELETSRAPFDGPDAAAVAEAHRTATPPPMSAVNPSVTSAYDGVAIVALQKLPSSRYASAAAMASALRAASGAGAGGGSGGVGWWVWALVAAVVVLAVIVVVFLTRGETVTVPDVVGKSQAEATAAIEAVGLEVGEVAQEADAEAEPGTVLSQDPAAGEEADEGSAVDIVISAVPEVTVPDVVGLTQEDATAALQEAGLVVGTVTPEESADVEPGTVMAQDPEADTTANQGSPVNLTVAAAKEVEVPDVVNMTQEEAAAALEAAGLTVGEVTQEPSDRVAPGLVVKQDPRAGTKLAAGGAVALVLATAPPIDVPGVVGRSVTEAATALLQAGFVIGDVSYAYDAGVDPGHVISQDPAAGAQAPKGTAIALVVSLGQQQGEVPSVVGLTEPDAVSTLEAAGFTVEIERLPDTAPAGEVVGQTPEGGDTAPAGSTVTITISAGGGEQTVVPDVVGQDVASALLAIGEADLTVKFEFASSEQDLVVLAQDPPGGTEVYPGTPVTLTVGVALAGTP